MPLFPGMDPFLEGQIWEDFHTAYIGVLRMWLVPLLGDTYIATVEQRVYIERHLSSQPFVFRPEVTVISAAPSQSPVKSSRVSEPVLVPLVMPEEVHEPFMTIRTRDANEVVTVIELLSPTNKRGGSDGHREYLSKRQAVLGSRAHLVEIDLLRGGERLPMGAPLPDGDYFVIVSRTVHRPMAQVHHWSLREPMPVLPIPLQVGDNDAMLDLQGAFDEVYLRAGYDRAVDHTQALAPPLAPQDAEWMANLLAGT